MSASDMSEVIEKVLQLDRDAAPGPWWHCCDGENPKCERMVWSEIADQETPVCRTLDSEPDSPGALKCGPNARLIATYRTAAPALARALSESKAESELEAIRRAAIDNLPVDDQSPIGAIEAAGSELIAARESLVTLRERVRVLEADFARRTGPEMRAAIVGILDDLRRQFVIWPGDYERIADAIMSLLRGEGR